MCNSEIIAQTVDLSDPKVFNEAISTKLEFWSVDEFGNMKGKYGQNISCDDLTFQNWLDHYLVKEENSLSKEFYFAFIEALKNAGFKKLIIDLKAPAHPITAEK